MNEPTRETTAALIQQHRAKASDYRRKMAETQDAGLRVFYESNALAYETIATQLQLSATCAAEIEETNRQALHRHRRLPKDDGEP